VSRSKTTCAHCATVLGFKNASSKVFHPAPGAKAIYVDLQIGTTLLCPACGKRTVVRAERIDLSALSP